MTGALVDCLRRIGGKGTGVVCLVFFILCAMNSKAQTSASGTAVVKKQAWCSCEGEVELKIQMCQIGSRYKFVAGNSSQGGSTLHEVRIPMGGPNTVTYTVSDLCPGTYQYDMLASWALRDGEPLWGRIALVTVVVEGPEKFLSANAVAVNGGCIGAGSAVTTARDGNPGYSYQLEWWNPALGIFVSCPSEWGTQNGPSSTGLKNGRYRVKVTDSKGCFVYAEFEITGQGTPVDFTLATEDTPCTGGGTGSASISNISGSTNYTITWSPGGPGGNATTWSPLAAGSYSVTVTDIASGCAKTIPFVIKQRVPVTASVAVRQSGCEGPNTGRIEVLNVSGMAPLTYTWSPNVSTGPVADDLEPGSYTVSITDADGCTWSQTIVIREVPPLEVSLASRNFRNAQGACRGRATVVIDGGTAPFSINWIEPSGCSGVSCEGPAPGTYTVEVVDANGCTQTQSIQINCTASRIVGVSPNPFDYSMDVEFVLDDTRDVLFRLFDMTFAPVYQQDLGSFGAGTHTETLSIPTLPTGTYYLNLVLNGVEQQDLLLVVRQ